MPHVIENEDGTVSYRCPLCEGASHPATGCVYSAGFVVCWRCTLEGARWVQAWTNAKSRRSGLSFYAHVHAPQDQYPPHGTRSPPRP